MGSSETDSFVTESPFLLQICLLWYAPELNRIFGRLPFGAQYGSGDNNRIMTE
jgi:hypothetical protein